MNKILLICSHLGSDCDNLVSNLDSGSKLQKLEASYNSIDCLSLKKFNYKYHKRPLVYFDHLVYNYQFSYKELFKYLYFVYYIENPKKAIANIVANKFYNQKTACDYYCLRLRRMYEMIKKSKNSLVFFDEDANNPEIYKKIHKMLGINDRLKIKLKSKNKQEIKINKQVLDEAEEFYEKYRYVIGQLKSQKKKG